MSKHSLQVASLTALVALATALAPLATAASTANTTDKKATAKGEKPTASPGWVVIEEDWFYPLRFDPVFAMDSARYYYRRGEEQAASRDVGRALAWLDYAASHALPVTKEKIDDARTDLKQLQIDLENGTVSSAAQLDSRLANASSALAEWHYFKAREAYGKYDLKYAAEDLQAAVTHLRHAADSAHYEYGPDTVTVFDNIMDMTETVDHNVLGKYLDGVESATQELGNSLSKASNDNS